MTRGVGADAPTGRVIDSGITRGLRGRPSGHHRTRDESVELGRGDREFAGTADGCAGESDRRGVIRTGVRPIIRTN